ncbi:hypothetical protein [Halorarius halobius]|uniref:hypothetical protein n=1 Tax=Halorarius halobius TaxID=2962671 RepID=UPI0020CD9ECC|nr:hypothetical protein [Halorarius halobius]
MSDFVPEWLAEAATLAFELVVTLLLTAAGVGAELQSAQVLGTNTVVALWFGYMGAVALYGGVVVFGSGRLLPRVRGA